MISFYFIIGIIYSVLLSFICVLCLLRLCKQIDREGALNLLKYPSIIAAALSTLVLFSYAMEILVAYYSGAGFELEAFKLRATGPYWWIYITPLLIHISIVLFFIKKLRRNLSFVTWVALLATVVNSGLFDHIIMTTGY